MSFDNSANFSFADNSLNYWTKPVNISVVTFFVSGGGGGGSATSSGGGGAFIYANYSNLNPDISYNITINIGGGGKAPPIFTGGQSIGGYVDPSGIIQSNGGSGSTLSGSSSGGGGGMTSIFYTDDLGNEAIKICAGGGGGGGSVSGSNGGSSGNIGVPLNSNTIYSSKGSDGTGSGGGQAGNSDLSGNAGLGGINGGVNGFDFIDGSNNQLNVKFIGGGGGNGGTFAGGGGGAGFGGAAGGKYGGGGGGGSVSVHSNFIFFTLGGGGAGGTLGQNGQNGSVIVYWNNYQPTIPRVIVQEFMLDSQHTCKSIYTAPSTKPKDVLTYAFPSSIIGVSNPYSGVIGVDGEVYTITPNGNLYSFNHLFIFQWVFSVSNYIFFGSPVISSNGTLYVSARTSSPTQTTGYFYAIVDNTTNGALKWSMPFPLQDNYDNPSTSPVSDASGNIFFGTQNGSIYAVIDQVNQAIYGWKFPPVVANVPVTGTPVFDASYTKLCYTTSDYINTLSSVYVLDLSKNSVVQNILPTLRWSKTITGGEYYNTPSFGEGYIYVNTTAGNVYAYDISNNVGNTNYTRWPLINVNDISLSNIALNTNNQMCFTSQNALNVIDSSNGQLLWTYPIDPSGANVPDNSTPIIDASNNIIFGSRSKHLYSVDGIQRRFNWRYAVGGAIEAMPIIGSDGSIYVAANNAVLYDFSSVGINITPTTSAISSMYMLNIKHTGLSSYYGPSITPAPLIAWSADFVSGNLFVSPSIGIAADGTLYIGSNDGYVYSYTDGQASPNWHVQLNNTNTAPFTSPNSMYTTPLISPDGTIYIGSNEGYLFALDPSGGTIKWSYSAGYPLQSSPIMDASGSIYFGAGNNVYAVGDAGYAGYNKWLIPYFPTNAHVNSSPALGQNGYLYFGSDDGFVYAVDSFLGIQKWSFDANNYNTPPMGIHPIYTSATVDASNNVIIGNGSYMNGTLFYLDGLTGALIWSKTSVDWGTNANIGPFYNTVAVKGDTIYLSTIAYVYAINRLTGIQKWYYFNTNCYYTSPIIDASGTLFFASIKAQDDPAQGWLKNDGILHSITDMGNSFTSNWSIKVASLGRLAPPVLGDNNTIYITSTSNKIYAIR
jgi:outer membrane protein assembly factor BamB